MMTTRFYSISLSLSLIPLETRSCKLPRHIFFVVVVVVAMYATASMQLRNWLTLCKRYASVAASAFSNSRLRTCERTSERANVAELSFH